MSKSFDEIQSEYCKLDLSDLQIFKISKISQVVMTTIHLINLNGNYSIIKNGIQKNI